MAHIGKMRQEAQPLTQSLGLFDLIFEGSPTHQLHGVVERSIGLLAELIHRHNIRVLELTGHPGLAQEALHVGRALS